jgi:hypothetical protein
LTTDNHARGDARKDVDEMNEKGILCLDGWAGRSETPVEIVGETPKRYRIRAVQRMTLPGRARWIDAGEIVLVPKYSVRRIPAPEASKHAI